MVVRIINNHFIIDKFRSSPYRLPVTFQADIGLFHVIIRIVNDDIGPALHAIFYELLDARQFFLRQLADKFPQFLPPFIKIGVEISCLIVFPLEIFELKPVLPEFYRIYLGQTLPGEK